MSTKKVEWSGNFVAVVTPFEKDGDIDEQRFVENVERLASEGADGFIVAGCTGEGWAVAPGERARLFALTRGAIPDATVIAGVSEIAARDVIPMARAALDEQADGILILPPYYALPGRRDTVAFFRTISDAVPIPIMVYNNPARTGVNLDPDVLEELAEIEQVAAVKESSGDFEQTERTIRAVGDRLLVFTGHTAERGAASLLMGAVGFVSSSDPQVMGRRSLDLYRKMLAGDLAEARAIQMETLLLNDTLARAPGTSAATLKAAMNVVGRPAGYPRPPILPLTPEEVGTLEGLLAGIGITANGG